MPAKKMAPGDFDLIKELLETIQLKVVAEKWDVNVDTIRRYLSKRSTSQSKIVREYRVKEIKIGIKKRELPVFTAKRLGISMSYFYTERVKLLAELK